MYRTESPTFDDLKSYVDTTVDQKVEFKHGKTVPNDIDLSYYSQNRKTTIRNNSKYVEGDL